MARLAREHIVTPQGGFFHVFNRVAGASRYFPFRKPRVRRKFIRWLRYRLRCFCIDCAGFVLMGNHYHLVVQVPEFRQLSMSQLQGYAQARWGGAGSCVPVTGASLAGSSSTRISSVSMSSCETCKGPLPAGSTVSSIGAVTCGPSATVVSNSRTSEQCRSASSILS